ncbi:hypothetical protein EON80_04180 [bacterium]|nr:MAG: hypothetical protein EON80_04180 [bacterium]
MFLFASESFNQFTRRLHYLRQYSEARKQQVEQIQKVQEALNSQLFDLTDKRNQKKKLLNTQLVENRNLLNLKSEQDQVVTKLSQREQELQRDLREKQNAVRKLENLISDIVREEVRKAANAARKEAAKNEAAANQFGVKLGDLRVLAKKIKLNPELATALWETDNIDAMLLATLLMKPKQLATEDLEKMVRAATFPQLADWLNSYVVKMHPQKEQLRPKWIESTDAMVARSGWSLTAEKIVKDPAALDFDALLNRLENEMPTAPVPAQWTMNFCLAHIGITSPQHRERAITIGEKLGIYRDYPVHKGCTSPFAPIWIKEMVKRQS